MPLFPTLLILLLLPPTSPSPCPSSTTCPSSPPFSYPFSSTPGCGHPSFQIQCPPSNPPTINIKNQTFTILTHDPNSTTLTLTPITKPTTCTSQISLSNTPFRISDTSCSRLSTLKPCPHPSPINCTHCPFQCTLLKSPTTLFPDCDVPRRHQSDTQVQPTCQLDLIGFIDNILRYGFDVDWDDHDDDDNNDPYFSRCKSCNGVCGYNVSNSNLSFICYSSSSMEIKQGSPNLVVILCIVSLFCCSMIAMFVTIAILRSRKKALLDVEEDPFLFLRRHPSASLLPPVFTYDELDLSTNGFDEKRKIGDGGFGSVFLGQLADGRLVAVKHLHKQCPGAAAGGKGFSTNKSFCNEILILSSINHPNLVKLHGYCSDPRGLLLVYDYVPNGTVSDHLHGNVRLTRKGGTLRWNTRVEIALQTAMAIEYLHFAVFPPIVHRDITSTNIFIEKDMRVKVGDFGLSRLLVCSESTLASGNASEGVWTGPQGTPGYLDPDYYKSFRLNEKSDIYSFGVVLLELITGMRAVDQTRTKMEMTLVDMVVPRIQMGLLHEVVDHVLVVDGEAMDGVRAVAELAFQCVASDKDDRPDAREVVAELRRIKGCRRSGVLRVSNSSNVVVPDGVIV